MQHIYLASVTEVPDEFETKLDECNKQRRAKVLRCKNISDKKRSYLAGRLLSYATQEAACDEEAVCLAPYNWEQIKQEQNIHRYYANISHSGEYVAVALSDEPVGVDIEQYKTRYGKPGEQQTTKRSDALARRVLSEQEYACYQSFCEHEAEDFWNENDFFLKLWTRKEAYAKWNGKGIAMDFSKINALQETEFYSQKLALGEQDFLWMSVYPPDAQMYVHSSLEMGENRVALPF